MNVNRVAEQRNYSKTADAVNPKTNRKTNQAKGGDFYESLSGNMYGQAAGQGEKETTGVQHQENTAIGRNTVHTSYQYQSVTSAIALQSNGGIHADAVIDCAARNISYAESDCVKTYVEQGFALKAKVDITAHAIYVEQKYEDGTVKGYEVDYGKLDEKTENPVEQIALEAWEMARRAMMGDAPFHEVTPEELLPNNAANRTEEGENAEAEEKKDLTDMTVEEALAEFYDFIQNRIKNGPPKYLIGASEFSVEEWEKLLDGVDGELDEIREEMRERIEKLKEQALQNDLDTPQGRVRLYEREGRLESGIIGLHVFEDNGQFFSMSASYAEDSTAENPIVEVRIKQEEGVSSIRQITVQIAVNQVDVSSATQLEMLALCSHGDKQGLAGFSKTGDSYRKLLEQAQEAGHDCNQAANLTDFLGKKQNWSVLEKTTEAQIQSLFEERTKADNGVPYHYLAKDGIIEYNGVIFVCDEKHKAICLGNTANMEECLRIPLADGGCLIVNRDNLGDLSKAISMFSPEDVNRIMRAIAQDAKVQQMKNEIEETPEISEDEK